MTNVYSTNIPGRGCGKGTTFTIQSDPKKCNFLRDDLLKDKIRIDMLFYTNKIVT